MEGPFGHRLFKYVAFFTKFGVKVNYLENACITRYCGKNSLVEINEQLTARFS